MQKPEDIYKSRIATYSTELEIHKKKLKRISICRIITMATIIITSILLKNVATTYYIVTLVPLFGLFLYFIIHFGNTKNNHKLFSELIRINENELNIIKGKYGTLENFHIDNEHQIHKEHPYAADLDIVGNNSLFNLINRTCCHGSENLLLNRFLSPVLEKEEILERQESIKELSSKIDFRQQFQANGRRYKETSTEDNELIHWLNMPDSKYSTAFFRISSIFLSLASLLLITCAFLNFVGHNYWITSVCFNLIFISYISKKGGCISHEIQTKDKLIKKLSNLMLIIYEEAFMSQYLMTPKEQDYQAYNELKKLAKTLNYNKSNNFITKGFFLPDLHLTAAVERWRRNNKDKVHLWIQRIYRIDELNSLSNFSYNNNRFCFPTFKDQTYIHTIGMGHPLLKHKNVTTNSFKPKSKSVILTGANMSGKSTFLRTIGINLVLAYTGAPVFAERFECCLAKIFTSMRLTDSLEEGRSYFYSELKRLGSIIDKLRSGQKVFILIDEMLKGTNSVDKLSGSIGLAEEFLRHDCFCVIATHDLEMGNLEAKYPELVENNCFESEIIIDKIYFDYKIRQGIAKNKNASFLLKKMKLIK